MVDVDVDSGHREVSYTSDQHNDGKVPTFQEGRYMCSRSHCRASGRSYILLVLKTILCRSQSGCGGPEEEAKTALRSRDAVRAGSLVARFPEKDDALI